MSSTTDLVLLLPPSEGKAPGGHRGAQATSFARSLGQQRRIIRDCLAAMASNGDETALTKVLGVRGDLLARAVDATSLLATARPPLLPAWQRYTGVVWEHLAPERLTAAERSRILVPSGVYGLTTADDLIADYRLKLSAVLPGIGKVGPYWRSSVSTIIGRREGGIIVDLLPTEHLLAVDLEYVAQRREVVSVRFVGSDGTRAAGHAAKAVKGKIARRLLIDGLDGIDGVSVEGWRVMRRGDGFEVRAPR